MLPSTVVMATATNTATAVLKKKVMSPLNKKAGEKVSPGKVNKSSSLPQTVSTPDLSSHSNSKKLDKKDQKKSADHVKVPLGATPCGVKSKKAVSSSSLASPVGSSCSTEDDLREQVTRLERDVEHERQMRREQAHQYKLSADHAHAQASVASKDLRAKLLAEKHRELEAQRESLHKRYEHELGKAGKQRESEVNKLRADLTKCQAQLAAEQTGSGLSGNQRHAFEAERARLTAETQDLRGQKRRLEDLVRTAQEAERHMATELRQIRDTNKAQLSRARRDADMEIKKLLEELKAKSRTIGQLEKDTGAVQAAQTIAKQHDMLLTLATEMAAVTVINANATTVPTNVLTAPPAATSTPTTAPPTSPWDTATAVRTVSLSVTDSTDSALSSSLSSGGGGMGSMSSSCSSSTSSSEGQSQPPLPPDPGKSPPPPPPITTETSQQLNKSEVVESQPTTESKPTITARRPSVADVFGYASESSNASHAESSLQRQNSVRQHRRLSISSVSLLTPTSLKSPTDYSASPEQYMTRRSSVSSLPPPAPLLPKRRTSNSPTSMTQSYKGQGRRQSLSSQGILPGSSSRKQSSINGLDTASTGSQDSWGSGCGSRRGSMSSLASAPSTPTPSRKKSSSRASSPLRSPLSRRGSISSLGGSSSYSTGSGRRGSIAGFRGSSPIRSMLVRRGSVSGKRLSPQRSPTSSPANRRSSITNIKSRVDSRRGSVTSTSSNFSSRATDSRRGSVTSLNSQSTHSRRGSVTNVNSGSHSRRGSVTNVNSPVSRRGSVTNVNSPVSRRGSVTNVNSPVSRRGSVNSLNNFSMTDSRRGSVTSLNLNVQSRVDCRRDSVTSLSASMGSRRGSVSSLSASVGSRRGSVSNGSRNVQTKTKNGINGSTDIAAKKDYSSRRGTVSSSSHLWKKKQTTNQNSEESNDPKDSELVNQSRSSAFSGNQRRSSVSLQQLPQSTKKKESTADGDQSEASYHAMTELRVKLRKTEELVGSVTQDKADMLKRVKDFEKKFKQSQEKNRKFLEKNMDLTNVNRNLEEKIKKLNEENNRLKSNVEKGKKEAQRLSNRLNHDKQGKVFVDGLTEEIEALRQQLEDANKTAEALKLSCEEKDRRIELLAHRRKKQRATKQQQKAAGIKETYYGYDEDTKSLDSAENMSLSSSRLSSSRVSLDNTAEFDSTSDDVFDEFTREEFEKNYQRLAKEHMELEKSFALLQSQNGHSHLDPQREGKLRSQLESDLLDAQTKIEDLEKIVKQNGEDTSWVEEKEKLNQTIRKLKEKLASEESIKSKLESNVQELNEQNEVLEFRLLELEDCNEKLSEEVGAAILMSQQSPSCGGDGEVIKVYMGEGEEHEVVLQELKDNLLALRSNESVPAADRLALLQTVSVLSVAHRRVAELTLAQDALNQRIATLQHEKARLLVATETGLEADLVLEYEATRNHLLQANVKIQSLNEELADQQKSAAVYQYKEECADKAEQRYREEIAGLRRQVSASSEGSQKESELWHEKISQLKQAETTIHELEAEKQTFQETIRDLQKERETFQKTVAELQREVSDLGEQLDTQSMTESDKDISSHLKAKIMEQEKSESELLEKNEQLLQEINHLKVRLEEAEHNEGELTDQNLNLQDELESLHKRCNILQQELDITEEELEAAHRKCGHLEQEVDISAEKCASTERELQLACLAMEKMKNGADDGKDTVEFDTAKVLQSEDCTEVEVLKSEVVSLHEALDKKDKKIQDLKHVKEVFEKEEEDLSYLKEHLEIREQEIEELSQKLQQLEDTELETSEHVLELLEGKDQLESLLEEAKNKLSEEEGQRKRLQALVDSLENNKEKLQQNVSADENHCTIPDHQELANENAAYKTTLEELESEVAALREKQSGEGAGKDDETTDEDLRETIRELEEDLELARTQFEEAHEEFGEHEEELQRRILTLEKHLSELAGDEEETNITLYEEKIEELEKDVIEARERVQRAEEERCQKVEELQSRLDCMEENEKKLSETIEDLKGIEHELKGKVVEHEVDITDKDKMMEEKDKLQKEVEELRKKLKDVEQDPGSSAKIVKYEATIKELMETVDDLNAKESNLMKDIYEMKMENQELQEHIDELLEKASEVGSPRESDKAGDELNAKVRDLTEENAELREQMFRAKLSGLDTIDEGDELAGTIGMITKDLNNRIEELEKNEVDLKVHIKQANAEIESLNVELQEKEVKSAKLVKKLEVLEMSEDKLMEQLDLTEQRNEKLEEELEMLRSQPKFVSSKDEVVENESKDREQDLLDEIERLKVEMNKGFGERDHEELNQLRNKVDILLETEEKLIDRLQEQEGVELRLKSRISELDTELNHEKSIHASRIEKKSEDLEDITVLARTIEELKDREIKLKVEVNKLEKSEVELLARVTCLTGSLHEYERSTEELHEQIAEFKHGEVSQKHRVTDLERTVTSLESRVEDLKTEKKGLVSTLEAIGQTNKSKETFAPLHDNSLHDASFLSGGAVSLDTTYDTCNFVPLDPARIPHMEREEMISALHELERMESYHRMKIRALSDNLEELRGAVEVVAVTMETDAGIPIIKYKPKFRDSEFEARVQELVKSESALKMRVLELEKKEMHLKRELTEAESILKEQEQDFKDELDDLEDELNEVRKNEARLKNKLQYGHANSVPETPALAKIQHLEELVCDLETSETKLKRRLQEARQTEDDLKARLVTAAAAATSGGKNGIHAGKVEWEEKERQFSQDQQLQQLLEKERELEAELEVLRKDDNTEKLAKRVSELQRTEKGLRLKLEILEAHQPSLFDGLSGNMLETPEDILRQRIRELEKMEKHHKQQVAELEKDREELHEIARGDKNTIHELSVQLREHQLRDKSLKEQLNRCEQSESLLQLRCDDLVERTETLEEKLRQATSSERSSRAQLEKHKHAQNDLSMKLEHSQEDLQTSEHKLKRRIEELQKEKRELRERCDELTDRIGDLEGAELTLKQRLRNIENNETQLKGRVNEYENRDSKNEQRRLDLEHFNDALNDKLHKLEEEKANLLYNISDLEISREEANSEVITLKSKVAVLERKLSEYENRKSSLETRLDEFTTKEVALHAKLTETSKMEQELKRNLEEKQIMEVKLKKKMEALEAECVATDEKVKSAAAIEKQLPFLQSQIEYHQRTQSQLDEENVRLKERIHRYEHATANRTMAQLPSTELQRLREQEKVLDELEKTVVRLEQSEQSLKLAVEKLRDGQEACGHEFELNQLKTQIANSQHLVHEKAGLQRALNTTKKANELLKSNHEDTKQQLSRLQAKLQKGDLNIAETVSTSTKSIQAHLAETINLKGLTPADMMYGVERIPEFKHALKSLGARYPQAYDEFVRHLQPSERDISHVRVRDNGTVGGAMATEEAIAPSTAGVVTALPAGTVRVQVTKNRDQLIDSLVDALPKGNVKLRENSEGKGGRIDAQSQANNKSKAQLQRPLDSEENERAALIGGLVDAMTTENPLWREVEGRRSNAGGVGRDDDYWEQLEKNMGDTDDMMLTINFGAEDESRPESAGSSGPPPPLPGSHPPAYRRSQSPESYYLPSADEASELEDDVSRSYRAGSAPPDSAYSEGSSLPTLGMGLPPTRKGKKKLAASLDSIPDDSGFQDVDVKILRDRIAYLEGQVKVKDNEVKDMQDKVKDAEEVQELKSKLNEKEEQLDLEKKVNQDQMDKLSRTTQELTQTKAAMDKVKAKIPPSPAPTDSSVTLQLKGPDESTTNHMLMKAQLDRKERELEAKNNEADRLSTELRCWQQDCRDARDDKNAAESSLAMLQDEMSGLQEDRERLHDLEEQFKELQQKYADLEARWKALQSAGEEKSALEKIVLKLRGQLGDLERIDLERSDLETKVKALEGQLKEKSKHENLLTKDNAKMQHQIDDLANENSQLKNMEDDYNKVRSKFTEMEQLKTKAQLAITPLRAKVLRLAHKCKAKDDLLREVVSALHSGSGGPELLPRADAALQQSTADEYTRPISPVTARAITEFEKECNNSSLPITPSSPQLLSLRAPHPVLEGPPAHPMPPPRRSQRNNKSRPSNSLETTSESDETTGSEELDLVGPMQSLDQDVSPLSYLSLQPVTQLNIASPTKTANGRNHGAKYQHHHNGVPATNGGFAVPEMYRAIKDYEPQHFSRSGHQRLELPLKEGDIVKALGPQDDRGYFEAQVGGKVGLVPVSYLVPLPPAPPPRALPRKTRPHSVATTTGQDTSPEQILAMHQQLQRSHTPNHYVPTAPSIVHPAFAGALSPRIQTARPPLSPLGGHNPGNVLGHFPAAPIPVSAPVVPQASSSPSVRPVPPSPQPPGPLEPPTHLRIQRTVGEHSLLVSWSLPTLDEFGRCNGTTVRGYKIYIDSKDRQTVPSPHMTKALIEKLNLRRPHSFSIQTVGESNRVSRLTDTVMFEDVLPDNGDDLASANGDVNSVVSSADSGADRKVHVALYDYAPSASTPHPSQHLTFMAGDVVVTYGKARPDGLYNGKVQGKRGLVPASFIEEVALLKSKGRRSMSLNSSATSVFSSAPHSIAGSSSAHTGGPRSASRQSITSSASGRRSAQRI